MEKGDKWYPVIAMVVVEFAFAIVNILLKKLVDNGTSHLVFITYRQSISTMFLAPIAFFLERNSRPKITLSILCCLFLSAIVGASLTQYFFLLGIEYTSATFSCAFINVVPVITFIMALPFGLETLNIERTGGKAKVVGTVVCLGGAMLMTLYRGVPLFHRLHGQEAVHRPIEQTIKLGSGKRKEKWTMGSVAMLAGTLLWSSWFPLQSYIGKRYPCQYSSTAIMTFFAAIQSATISLSMERNLSMWVLKGKVEILSIIYAVSYISITLLPRTELLLSCFLASLDMIKLLNIGCLHCTNNWSMQGMIGSGLCYVVMSWCVKKRGPVFTAAFSPLVQIMAGMFDIPVLHEQLHLGSLLGSIIVIVGLYLLLWGKNKDMKDCAAKVAQATEEIKDQEIQFQVIEVTLNSRHP
ncbi:hypothetical protein RJ640_020639 [Escallonia rubra]|uniref:WAT1-related protein n=1 Tax=Escallonia rubra TaxID=112253 RepID=A0AA88UU28_9ASTE|nr:hypothetical protein RJ640_020639 [Escallonia rubra]